jgi:hypothetical protein
MRIYIIGNDGITLCREPPAALNDGEIAVASNEPWNCQPLDTKRAAAWPGAFTERLRRIDVGAQCFGERAWWKGMVCCCRLSHSRIVHPAPRGRRSSTFIFKAAVMRAKL